MAFQEFKTVQIDGIAACVPANVEENATLDLFANAEEYDKFVASTGIDRKRVISEGVCASDLCLAAAEKLIAELNLDKDDIDCLIFVSQTPDYKLPATSCVLHGKL